MPVFTGIIFLSHPQSKLERENWWFLDPGVLLLSEIFILLGNSGFQVLRIVGLPRVTLLSGVNQTADHVHVFFCFMFFLAA